MKFHSKKINVLSFFDGISCGQLALKRAGIEVDRYFAAEIDKHAIKITQKNFPDTIQLGSVEDVIYCSGGEDTGIMNKGSYYYPCYPVDLLLGGSPCQGFSNAGEGLNFNDPRSKLFFEYVRILKEIRVHHPQVIFLLENVKMKKEWRDVISKILNVEPILINSALVSGQRRERYYWTNIKGIEQPVDKGILLKDVLLTELPIEYIHTEKAIEYMNRTTGKRNHWDFAHHSDSLNDKSAAVVSNFFKGTPYNVLIDRNIYLNEDEIEKAIGKYKSKTWSSGNRMGNMKFPDDVNRKSKCVISSSTTSARETIHIEDLFGIRKLHPIEYERLQTLPDNYTEGISDTQRYKAIGNGWTVDVISHILSFAK